MRVLITFFLFAAFLSSVGHGRGLGSRPERRLEKDSFGKLPMRFEQNVGQADPAVKFLCRAAGYTLFLTANSAVMALPKSSLSIHFAKTEADLSIEGAGALPGTTNYFLGNDPQRWLSDIRSYGAVKYREIYPGIDLVFRGHEHHAEYDFVVAPGADPRRIHISFDGARRIDVGEQGDLVLDTPSGLVIQRKPRLWQQTAGGRKEIQGAYSIEAPSRVGFEISSYDHELPLVIDPELVYATYLGGSGSEQISALAVSGGGDIYVAGSTDGHFPVTPRVVQDSAKGRHDIFVARLNAAGSQLVYATYLGSSAEDFVAGIAVDAQGNAYLTGVTGYDRPATDFPVTPGAYQAKPGGNADAFVTKLNPTGSALVYSTYLGGSGFDGAGGTFGGGIAIDSAGSAYVTGTTYVDRCRSEFPVTAGVFRAPPGWCYGYLSKLNPAGTALIFSTDVGGQDIALDPDGNIYLAGYIGDSFSTSDPFPTTPGAFRRTCRRGDYAGAGDAFVAKIDSSGQSLLYSTCFAADITDLAVDAAGNAYVTGTTISPEFTTTAGALRTTGNSDCDANANANTMGRTGGSCEIFVSKLNATGAALIYSTYLAGANPGTSFPRISVDALGNAYLAGSVYSPGFPIVPDAFPAEPGWSGFLSKLNATGAGLVDSTLLTSGPQSIALDPDGSVYLAGSIFSANGAFTAPGGLQTSFGGGGADGFISRIRLRESAILPQVDPSGVVNAASFLPGPIAPGELVTIFGSAFGPAQLETLQLSQDGRVDSLLAGTRVLFDGIPSLMIYAMSNQLTAVVSYALASKTSTQLQVEYLGNRSNPATLPVSSSQPGIFTVNSSGTGQGAIDNVDRGAAVPLTPNSSKNPASAGSEIYVYVTGAGQMKPPGGDGEVTSGQVLIGNVTIEARIGGVKAEVVSATAAPGTVSGVVQVDVRIPAGISSGDAVPIVLMIGGVPTQAGVTLAIR